MSLPRTKFKFALISSPALKLSFPAAFARIFCVIVIPITKSLLSEMFILLLLLLNYSTTSDIIQIYIIYIIHKNNLYEVSNV